MSLAMPERLYQLLPALYRLRDADHGQPLRALLATIETEFERIEAGSAAMYDNWFIETCDEWVVPYIGDLLGVRPIRAVESAGVSQRAYVANTIAYRRRKGTATVLEQLARDTTGWPARAVEFFERLATTQHMNHVRLNAHATAGLRNAAAAELAGGAFDRFGHSAEVRHAATRHGRYNLMNVGLFLWRLRSYGVGTGQPGDENADFVSARQMSDWWSIHPAGVDAPLFNKERSETTITHLAEEHNVPGPLRRLALHEELERLRRSAATPPPRFMTAGDPVLRLWLRLAGEAAPVEVRREDIYLCEIPDGVEFGSPTPRVVALDPARGRLAFPAALAVQEVWVQHLYGFSGDLGGGPYDRSAAVRAANTQVALDVQAGGQAEGFYDPGVWQCGVSHLLADDGSGTLFASLADAVTAWNALPPGRTGVIVLMDSLTDRRAVPIEIHVAAGSRLLIVAGQWLREPVPPPGAPRRFAGRFEAQQVRPHLAADIVVRGGAAPAAADAGACFINGLLLEGRLTVAGGHLGQLGLAHCTLLPPIGALTVEEAVGDRLLLTLDKSIVGSVSVRGPLRGVTVNDCIVGSDSGGSPDFSIDAPQAALELQRSSMFGAVSGLTLSASDCIFAAPVTAARRQTGCVRFSHVPPGSAVPRRYRCQPALEIADRLATLRQSLAPALPSAAQEAAVTAEVQATTKPLFVSLTYGDPGFGQLEQRCAAQIRQGAESGAEMGAFEFLKQPQREANLRDAVAEYLRFGLEAGVFFVT